MAGQQAAGAPGCSRARHYPGEVYSAGDNADKLMELQETRSIFVCVCESITSITNTNSLHARVTGGRSFEPFVSLIYIYL